ncbi:MAG: hypothetical protein WBL21_08035 [Salinimicrobium sp.]
MRRLKFMLVVFGVFLSTSSFSNSLNEVKTSREPVEEIQKMLVNSDLIIEEEFTVTIIFKVTGDRRINIQAVHSENEEMNGYIKSRLQNKKLTGSNWFTEKIYELPVKVQALK